MLSVSCDLWYDILCAMFYFTVSSLPESDPEELKKLLSEGFSERMSFMLGLSVAKHVSQHLELSSHSPESYT